MFLLLSSHNVPLSDVEHVASSISAVVARSYDCSIGSNVCNHIYCEPKMFCNQNDGRVKFWKKVEDVSHRLK